MSDQDCIFCKIINGDIPSFKVFENDDVLAFLDINPISKGHTIVIPKTHSENLLSISEERLSILTNHVRKISEILKTKINFDGFNIIQNNFQAAGQVVNHIHFHIIPRWNNDNLKLFPPQKQGDMKELEDLAKKIGKN